MRYNQLIDHTLLKQDASSADIKRICEEALKYHFKSVCINPGFVKLAKQELDGSDIEICTVIGFPLGATTTKAKIYEAKDALKNGATELDMVINVSMLKDHNDKYVLDEIKKLKKVAKKHTLKVIIETCLLTEEEKVRACLLAKQAKADFVKTSTGFSIGGATVEDVRLMRKTVGHNMGVKASGGIRDKKTAEAMVKAGANRIGASSGIKIVTDK